MVLYIDEYMKLLKFRFFIILFIELCICFNKFVNEILFIYCLLNEMYFVSGKGIITIDYIAFFARHYFSISNYNYILVCLIG